jgi:UDP-N-acetylmuramoyl-L-alanyl-D-glutamate--2,6-diaminopimelate ligase
MLNDKKCCAVINMDDPHGKDLCALTKASIFTYGLKGDRDIRANNIKTDMNGVSAELITPYGNTVIKSPLLGEINIYNILAAAGAALASGVTLDKIKAGIANLKIVPGRLERVSNKSGYSIIVDYSHKPDALLKALNTLRPFVEKRLILVFGCGGDRDKGKRYDMGLIAGRNSDIVIITSDNPRTEEPESIISQIEKGVLDAGMRMSEGSQSENDSYLIEADRGVAIRKAVSIADINDTILIAGKGHEDYQIIGTTKRPFDDRKEALKAVDAL